MDNREYTLIPTQTLNRILKVLEKLEPKVQGDSRWITQEEAMKQLNCGDQTLRRLRAKGDIKYRTLGGRKGILIDRKSIESFNQYNSNKCD